MYELNIPIYNRELDDRRRRELAELLHRAKPDGIFLTFGRILANDGMLERECAAFRANKAFLEGEGFRVSAWLCPTIGYGSPFYGDNAAAAEYVHVRKLRGDEDVPGAYCPLDERFVTDFCKDIAAIAGMGVERLLFEDDFTFSGGKFLHDIGCACEEHMRRFCDRVGEHLTRGEAAQKVLSGGQNSFRDAWIDLQKETITGFLEKVERTAHGVNPALRMGLSANSSSFEYEGAPLDEYERVLAGDTKPFLRLTGAPYWTQALSLGPVIDAVRMQASWCGPEFDLMTEADSYPRPRHWVPAAWMEAYDMILQADGTTNGTLKYMVEYNSSAAYEPGYVRAHEADQPHYEEIRRRFAGKAPVGLHVPEQKDTFRRRVLGEDVNIDQYPRRNYMPRLSQWITADNSLPAAYRDDGRSATLAISESAREVTEDQLRRGVITDIYGARILMERGIDVGITSMERVQIPGAEYFCRQDQYIALSMRGDSVFYRVELRPGAEVDSQFILVPKGLGVVPPIGIEEYPRVPACYFYQNAAGHRLMIYTCSAETTKGETIWEFSMWRNYARQRQLIEAAVRFGCPLPVTCAGHPELYILCKEDENALSVGLWNLFDDPVEEPVLALGGGEYASVDGYGCTPTLEGAQVRLADAIPPWGFALLTLQKARK